MNLESSIFKKLNKFISSNILDIPNDYIDEMYKIWFANLNNPIDKINFVFNDKYISSSQNTPKNVQVKGIDLPFWFGDYENANKKIVILGIDPLRSEQSFDRQHINIIENNLRLADFQNDVTIGTPYALHEKTTRENACIGYWTLVEELTKKNNFVYCTDIYKTYYFDYKENTRSYSDKKFIQYKQKHQEILNEELSIINPDLIIVFGKIAHSLLLDKNCPKIGQKIENTKDYYKLPNKNVDVFTVIHLSKASYNSHMSAFLNANNIFDVNASKRDECAKAYIKIIDQSLNIR